MIKNKNIVLTISYGNYLIGGGGTDKAIKAHQEIFNKERISVIHLFPLHMISKICIPDKNYWGICIDGRYDSVKTTRQLCKYLKRLIEQDYTIHDVYIHHFRGVVLKELKLILDFLNTNIKFYIHDYCSICPEAGLVKQSGVFCGGDGFYYDKCKNCQHYSLDAEERGKDIREFFKQYKEKIKVIGPSNTAKQIWLKSYPDFEFQTTVISHQIPLGTFNGNSCIISKDDKINIAFVGQNLSLKGWRQWCDAVDNAIERNKNYEFFHLGSGKYDHPFIEQIQVGLHDKENMTDILRKNNIHCAVLWSLVPETYSYTYFESWAANAYVLTNSLSGNISEQVLRNKNGISADDPEELISIIENEEQLRGLINTYRNRNTGAPLKLIDNRDVLLTYSKDIPAYNLILNDDNPSRCFQSIGINILYRLYYFLKCRLKRKRKI